MEKRRFAGAEQRAESSAERGRENVRRILAKRAEALLEDEGLTAARAKGEAFALRPAESPKKTSGHEHEASLATFDGFDAVDLPVEAIREAFDESLNEMADLAVRFSYQPNVRTMRAPDGRTVFAVATRTEKGHGVRIDIHPADDSGMPDKQEILDLLKYEESRVLRWAAQGMSPEEISLVLHAQAATRNAWINEATISLVTRGVPADQAARKAVLVIDDILASRKRV